jgi:hypothetical protein
MGIKHRLTRLETQVRAREFNRGDVFADIERDTARLEYYEQYGKWPPDMTRDECRQLERDLLLILGKEQQGDQRWARASSAG